MTKKIYLLASFIIASILLQAYLAQEFYAVQYGLGIGESICNLNQTFNCEAVAASPYSKLFGIPNAILGLFLNLIMLVALGGYLVTQEDEEQSGSWARFFFFLSTFSLLTSVLLAAISIFLIGKFCIFCISLYALSFFVFLLAYTTFKKDQGHRIGAFLKELLKPSKVFITLMASIFIFSLLAHSIIKNEYSPKNLEKQIQADIQFWEESNPNTFKGAQPLFVVNQGAPIKLAEFAEFLCPHCATAEKSIRSFLALYDDVEFSFYAFPLDPACSTSSPLEEEQKSPGYSCTLAKGVLCAEKQGLGEALHHHIFENQKDYANTAYSKQNKGLREKILGQFSTLDKVKWESCLEEPTSHEALVQSVQTGVESGVKGTPAMYMGGKKLPSAGHSTFLLLKAAYERLKTR